MRLETARVRNFKSITDSGEFNIEDDVTCLVGQERLLASPSLLDGQRDPRLADQY